MSPRLCLIARLFLCGVKFQGGKQKEKRHRLPVWSLICPRQEISRFASMSQWIQTTSRACDRRGRKPPQQKWHVESLPQFKHTSAAEEKGGDVFDYNSKRGGRLVTAELLGRQTGRAVGVQQDRSYCQRGAGETIPRSLTPVWEALRS